jgi:RNA polymerase sigma-70 factor (ECF subfamily)
MTQPPSTKSQWIGSALSRHEGPLLRFAARLLGDADRAQDVVQDTFLRLCREDPARLDGHLVPWLFTVCRNRALDLRRKDRRTRSLDKSGAPEPPAPGPSPALALENQQALQGVRTVLATLPASQQEALRLKFQDGLSYKEIAAVTGLSVNHVGVLIHTGLKAVRSRVGPGAGLEAVRRMS